MTPGSFVQTLWRHRTTAIVRADREDTAARAMEAAVTGGIRIVEFTLTTPGALDLVADFARRQDLDPVDGLDRLVVGAGTVLTVEQARAAVKAGARFLVSPVFDERIVREAAEAGVASMPGIHTATEMLAAHRAGASLLKLFPAPAGGPAYLRSILAPMPFLRIVPTNGVDQTNLGAWLDAGAWGVGLVAPLFPHAELSARQWDAIEARAVGLRRAAASVTRGDPPEAHDPFAS